MRAGGCLALMTTLLLPTGAFLAWSCDLLPTRWTDGLDHSYDFAYTSCYESGGWAVYLQHPITHAPFQCAHWPK